MQPDDWTHGYNTSDQYTAGFYRELSPNWLDFTALCNGYPSPRRNKGFGFHYLELGCGMGVSLCMLASLYPEGKFIGVDFSPSHINHASCLAEQLQLNNIRFIEADFLSLLENDLELRSYASEYSKGFHYISCHGVFSWVIPEIQRVILRLCGQLLLPGGLFYCSYNTKPGWLGMSLFQHIVTLYADRGDGDLPYKSLEMAKSRFLSMIAASNQDTLPLAHTYPGLSESLRLLESYPRQYVLQEYANQGWAPLFFADMYKLCTSEKLVYLGSAVIPDSFEDLLPPALQQLISSESSPVMRQSIIDIAICKGFRRDVYIRGGVRLNDSQLSRCCADTLLQSGGCLPQDEYIFPISSGEVRSTSEEIKQLEHELASQSRSILDLAQSTTQTVPTILRWSSLLLQSGRIHIDRSNELLYSDKQAITAAREICRLILEGANYDCMPVASTGNAISINLLEIMVVKAIADGLTDDVLVACVYSAISSMGIRLRGRNGLEITESSEALAWLKEFVESFKGERMAQLARLGILGSITSESESQGTTSRKKPQSKH